MFNAIIFATIPSQRIILGISAYSLEEYIFKPFTVGGNLSYSKAKFNLIISKSLHVVENALGRLKGRFQCLSKRLGYLFKLLLL